VERYRGKTTHERDASPVGNEKKSLEIKQEAQQEEEKKIFFIGMGERNAASSGIRAARCLREEALPQLGQCHNLLLKNEGRNPS